VNLTHVNRRALENLIRSGAFGSMEGNRAQLLEIMPKCVERAGLWQKQSQAKQMTLFDFAAETPFEDPAVPLPEMEEFAQKEILKMEKEVIGLYLSGHPLTPYTEILSKKTSGQIGDLNPDQDGMLMIVGGIVTNLRRSVTKKGQMMVYLTLEDLTGTLEALVFPKTFARYSAVLEEDVPVLVRGRLSAEGEQIKIFAEELEFLRGEADAGFTDGQDKLYLNMGDRDQEDLAGLWREIQRVIGRHPGSTPLYLYYPKARKLVEAENCYWVHYSNTLTADLEGLLGTGQVKLVSK
jgi:DNA polymerase-3 subunit alpha